MNPSPAQLARDCTLVNPKTGKILGLTKVTPPRQRGHWELVKEMEPRKRKKLIGQKHP